MASQRRNSRRRQRSFDFYFCLKHLYVLLNMLRSDIRFFAEARREKGGGRWLEKRLRDWGGVWWGHLGDTDRSATEIKFVTDS